MIIAMDWFLSQLFYVLLSTIVATLIWIEGDMLRKTDGALPQSIFFHASSLIDTLWFFVSMAVWYFIDLQPLAVAIPIAYGIYTIGGWIYGTYLLRRDGVPDSSDDLVIPLRYVSYSQSFAFVFSLLCAFVLMTMFFPNLLNVSFLNISF